MGEKQEQMIRAASLAEQALSDGDFAAAERHAQEALAGGTSYEALV